MENVILTKKAKVPQYELMTETPLPKLIGTLAVPTIISMLVTNLYNMADSYFVSQLGTSASGAIGIVFSIMAILQALGFMLGHGSGSIISRKLGEKDSNNAIKFASTSFFLAIFGGAVIGIICIIFINPLMRFLGSTETILPYSRIYGFYILISAPAMVSGCVMNNILRYEGKASLAMIGLTSGAILNVIGDPILIFGFNMGMSGAGLSTAISQYISSIILYCMFLRGETTSKFKFTRITKDFNDVILILKTGFPSFTRQSLSCISTTMLNQFSGLYGDAAIAAMSIVSRVCNVIFSICIGMGQGLQPVAAFNYGAKKYLRVRKAFIFAFISSTCIIAFITVITMIDSGSIIQIFRDDADVIKIGTTALRAQLIGMIFCPISVCSNMMFQSIGKSKIATFLAALRSGLCFIPVIFLMSNMFGLKGIEIAQPISDILVCLITIPCTLPFLKQLKLSELAVD
ncbi:MAG TPA: MATE family efflux transporter [Clostridium sp.]|nr:MATE family efflux transporter [Clostridium sp.]